MKKATSMGLSLGEAHTLSQIWKNTKKIKTKYDRSLMERVHKYCPQVLLTFDIEVLDRIYGNPPSR